MSKKLCSLLVLLMSVLALAAPAPQASAELILNEDPLPFGKSAELVVTLSWSERDEMPLPNPEELELPGATILDRYVLDLGTDGIDRKAEYHIIFTRFQSGDFEVGPLIIKTAVGDVKSQKLKMTFAGSTPKEGDKMGEIRTNKPVKELSTWDFWLWLAAVILAILALILLLAAIINHTGLLDAFRSPKARALKKLKRLKSKELPAPETLLGSAEILRSYLAEAYKVNTRETTSSEILRTMIMDNRCRGMKEISTHLLTSADLVKFAKKSVKSTESDDLMDSLVSSLQRETKVAPK